MVKDGGKALKDSGIVDAFGMLLETVGDILNPMSDLSNNRVPALTKALQPLAKVMALMADAAELLKGVINFSTGHISEGWGQMTHALGFGYSSGNGNNYQNLLDSYTEQQWGQSAADLSKAYEDAISRGDPSTIGITEDEWVRRYLGGNAAGTDNWRGGWTRVNENGLERIFLPSGSRIQTASETRYTSGDTYNTTVYVDHVDDLDTILRIAKTQESQPEWGRSKCRSLQCRRVGRQQLQRTTRIQTTQILHSTSCLRTRLRGKQETSNKGITYISNSLCREMRTSLSG